MAVPITDPTEGSICTGSWIACGGREYLYYTVRRGRGIPAPIRRSVSEDGYHFRKDEGFSFILPERYDRANARDPKVILGEDGRYHMFLTTVLRKENRGCLAHLVSDDNENWQEVEEPILICDNAEHPECPDYFVYQGRYYLVYSLGGHARYRVSEQPFTGFREPGNPHIPCEGVPKAAPWGDRMVFTGFRYLNGGYAGTMAFKAATAAENGELVFEEL
jgi:sucrose-6-phosphate hydrolase SacC (GH32 family)